MLSQTEETAVIAKTRELCQAILDQPSMLAARQRIENFMGDEQARRQYEELVSTGQALQQKQERSVQLTPEEVTAFQTRRDQLLSNPVAKGFLDAQEQMRNVHHSVTKYLSMTLENGRVPTEQDVEAATCGNGCSCGH